MTANEELSAPFTLKDEPLDSHRRMKVRVVGAGYSGIYLGIRIPQRLRNIDLQIYERNENVGGTWWVNRYPGITSYQLTPRSTSGDAERIACDVPSHSYQYTFHPNTNWSSWYAPGSEIQAYLSDTAERFGVMRYVKLLHEVVSCKWDNEAKRWSLEIRRVDTGETFHDDADVLILARGLLSNPSWPNISGLSTFEGELMHSAKWNADYNFKNKAVGVVGNGASAIQIIPSLQKVEGVQLSCFTRSKTWITNSFGEDVQIELNLDPDITEFSEEQRREFSRDPEKYVHFRKTVEMSGNTIHEGTLRGTVMQQENQALFAKNMRQRLASRPEIADFLVPTFGVGCRRPSPGPLYLDALCQSNVDFITEGIASVTPTGVILNSGREVDLDALVCATGFNTSSAPPFPIVGQSGLTLAKRFAAFPEAYLSTAVDSFPNMFIIQGPNSAIGAGSLVIIIESVGDYAIKCIRKLQKEDYASMAVKPAITRDWREYCHEYFKKTVYTDRCKSWYKSDGGMGDRIIGLWPGSCLHAAEALRAPRWEDYELENRGGHGSNLLGWLGNGSSVTHTKSAEDSGSYQGDPAWYLDPVFYDIPLEGRPEEDVKFGMRPFSH
ncbi:flavin-binding monooxygenase [Xylariaceae sp. FL0255]|nr:flavin-binding monooxygenase [Xylariaceae sp. FL0255]